MRTLTLLALFAGVSLAADPIKVELKEIKVKAATDELGGLNEGDGKLFLYTNGTMTAEVKMPDDGEFTLKIEMSCDEAKVDGKVVRPQVKISVGDTVVKDKFDLTGAETTEYKFDVKLKKGTQKIVIEYLNDTFKENEYDSNLYLHSFKVEEKKSK